MFKLKTPCITCPFKKGKGNLFRLNPQRLEEIFNATSFQCHKTVDFYEDEEGPFINVEGEDFDEQYKPIKNDANAQQCAGLMGLLILEDQPNQIMQVASRLKVLDLSKVDTKSCYSSFEEAVLAHEEGIEP